MLIYNALYQEASMNRLPHISVMLFHRETPTVWSDPPARETSTIAALVTSSTKKTMTTTISQRPVIVALAASTLSVSYHIRKESACGKALEN